MSALGLGIFTWISVVVISRAQQRYKLLPTAEGTLAKSITHRRFTVYPASRRLISRHDNDGSGLA
jgi:hypothetical protein